MSEIDYDTDMTKVPTDLHKALTSHAKAKTQWANLTPIAQRDFVTWVESAKQTETRKRRIARTCDMLASGKRRPCCYAVVPMNLYKALGANPKAKEKWSTLSSDVRRDIADWVESAATSQERAQRTEHVCALLKAGKKVSLN